MVAGKSEDGWADQGHWNNIGWADSRVIWHWLQTLIPTQFTAFPVQWTVSIILTLWLIQGKLALGQDSWAHTRFDWQSFHALHPAVKQTALLANSALCIAAAPQWGEIATLFLLFWIDWAKSWVVNRVSALYSTLRAAFLFASAATVVLTLLNRQW